MDTYTGVTYTKIPTKPSVVTLQFSTSDLISYINIIIGVVKMWDLREYNTLCFQPSDDTTTMTKARMMASSDDINWQQLIQIIRTHKYIHTHIHVYLHTHIYIYIYIYIHVYIYIYICIYIHTYIHTYLLTINIFTLLYIHIHIDIHTYIKHL